jgi:CheY-like chemotaxis protein
MLSCLIVDDSRRFLAAASAVLERQGITVSGVATSGAEAVAMAVELRPDVVLLDIDLGGESGFAVAHRLRDQGGDPPPRVILLSARAQEDYAELIAAAPVAGFLAKSDLSGDAVRRLSERPGT